MAGNLTATTDDESYHGSTSELPPTTSHGYAEWDFSDVPDPVMFQRFLDVVDYWFGYSDNSSGGSYDPTRECFVVLVGVLDRQTYHGGTGVVDCAVRIVIGRTRTRRYAQGHGTQDLYRFGLPRWRTLHPI
jgi:hypothetical protein